MTDMQNDGVGNVRFVYKLPTRGLIGFRSFFLRIARGNGAINSELLATEPIRGEVKWTRSGVIIATETGTAVTYGLRNAQERGETFVEPQTPVYEGMVVGMHNRDRDLEVNVCKERKMTNIRSSTSEVAAHLEPAVKFSLDEALDFMASDELVEVTPKNIRLRKRTLDTDTRYRRTRSSARAARS